MPRWIYNSPLEKCQHTKILCGQNKLLPIGKSCQKPKDHPGLSHFLMKPGCEKLPEHSNIFMSSDDTKSIEIAKLAVSLLPHLETNAPLPERLKEAAQTAAVLLQYTQRASDHTSRAAQNEIVQKAEEIYGRPWDEIENLSEFEREKIEAIAKRFRDTACERKEISPEEFLEKVLLPGRRLTIETLLATRKGYEKDAGPKLPLNLSTASFHGATFVRDFDKKKSTWLKRKISTQAKKLAKKAV